MIETKKCISCKERKPVPSFSNSPRGWLKRECDDCANLRDETQPEQSYHKPCADAPCNGCEYEKPCGILGLCCKPFRISLHYGARTTKHDWLKFPRKPDQYLDGSIPERGVI